MNLFPEFAISPSDLADEALPIYREWAYDFEKNEFLTRNGQYYLVEKDEAIRIWVFKALHTVRYRYQAYSHRYGHEQESLIGLSQDREILESEIQRYIEECLLVNPYIKEVGNFEFKYGEKNIVNFQVTTVYGVLDIENEVVN